MILIDYGMVQFHPGLIADEIIDEDNGTQYKLDARSHALIALSWRPPEQFYG